jgi:hypothetical protein
MAVLNANTTTVIWGNMLMVSDKFITAKAIGESVGNQMRR